MANLVIMVHSQFSETLLKGMFGKLPFNMVIVPYKEALLSVENHPTVFQQNIHARNLRESDIDYILIESNYGAPATETINQTLFNYILTNCPEAEIFAFSGTANSLVTALEHHARISAICKDATFLSDLSRFGLERVMTLPDLKRRIDPSNRRASAPPMMAPLENSQSIIIESPNMTRNRSASEPSEPTFTPYYHAYGESATPRSDYTSNTSTTSADYTPSTSSEVQKMRF
ncbi:hypothetical protein [Candidatus Berkiella aquae]|uniref:Uncharacterized protein n=1 Tax=Candidatus Berkiella aquae TaxID=295108 RepID=A0A0Q9YB63_9GAMM|nr:hypothetical protein [Candidatus Berkiella aquae]MCS5710620.1 hypothetical protein [Candidatus Berkiella aquae]